MSIFKEHVPFYREVFKIPGIFSGPFLTLGCQDFEGNGFPKDFQYKDLKDLILSKGVDDVKTLDLFDPRADLRYNLNFPVPSFEQQKYGVVFDIGTLEHVFDTRQCIENCLRMVKVDGLYIIHTPVNGYFGHGLHVFNPDGLIDALLLNNFEILYLKYTTPNGTVIKYPTLEIDVLIWVVARKKKEINNFNIPEQKIWEEIYNESPYSKTTGRGKPSVIFIKKLLKYSVLFILRPIWNIIWNTKIRLQKYLKD